MSKGLDSNQLTQALSQLIPKSLAKQVGVCARDEVNDIIEHAKKSKLFPLCLIVNTDLSSRDGEHWIALFIKTLNYCEYFDSYGAHPSLYHFRFPFKYIHLANRRALQSRTSIVCGHYCLYYLTYRSRGICSKRIFQCFRSDSLNDNDTSVRKGIQKLLAKRINAPIPEPCMFSHNQSCTCHKNCSFI